MTAIRWGEIGIGIALVGALISMLSTCGFFGCPDWPALPEAGEYRVVDAVGHEELLGAVVTVDGESVVIAYTGDGGPTTVTYKLYAEN